MGWWRMGIKSSVGERDEPWGLGGAGTVKCCAGGFVEGPVRERPTMTDGPTLALIMMGGVGTWWTSSSSSRPWRGRR
jgi:hypothetical protein